MRSRRARTTLGRFTEGMLPPPQLLKKQNVWSGHKHELLHGKTIPCESKIRMQKDSRYLLSLVAA